MGAYINPTDTSKEEWLKNNATKIQPGENVEEGYFPVCLVRNPSFTAAAIAFNEKERRRFERDDGRPKQWYKAKEEDLHTVSKELERYLEYM